MALIYSTPQLAALVKFIDARNRGASHKELLELKLAAMPGPPADAVQMRETFAGEPRAAQQWDQAGEGG
jgi:hypothetical protein